MLRWLVLPALSLAANACLKLPTRTQGSVQILDGAPRPAVVRALSDVKVSARFDPASKVATSFEAPSGPLAGSRITLGAGALAVETELILEEALPLEDTSLLGVAGLEENIQVSPIGSGLIIRPTEDTVLMQPLTIAMSIGPQAALSAPEETRLHLQENRSFVVFFKYFLDGELKAGIIPSTELTRVSDSVVFEGYFGAYWLAEVSSPVSQRIEVTSSEPIVNRDRVAVIATTGVVRESDILERTQIPVITWAPLVLTLEETSRQVQIATSIVSGPGVSQCKLDLFRDENASSGLVIDTGNQLKYTYSIATPEASTLQARFRCIDEAGRLAITSWSPKLSIPPGLVLWTQIQLQYNPNLHAIELEASISPGRSLTSCYLDINEIPGQTYSFPLTQSDLLRFTRMLERQDPHSLSIRLRCIDDLNRETISPWTEALTIPGRAAQTSMWANTRLILFATQADPFKTKIELSGQLNSGHTVAFCQAEFSDSSDFVNVLYQVGATPTLLAWYSVPKIASSQLIYGRFACYDMQDTKLELSPIAGIMLPGTPP